MVSRHAQLKTVGCECGLLGRREVHRCIADQHVQPPAARAEVLRTNSQHSVSYVRVVGQVRTSLEANNCNERVRKRNADSSSDGCNQQAHPLACYSRLLLWYGLSRQALAASRHAHQTQACSNPTNRQTSCCSSATVQEQRTLWMPIISMSWIHTLPASQILCGAAQSFFATQPSAVPQIVEKS